MIIEAGKRASFNGDEEDRKDEQETEEIKALWDRLE